MATSLVDIGAPYESQVLADELVKGNPTLGWRGDPRLELHVAYREAAKNLVRAGRWFPKGAVVDMLLVVTRHNEDGTDTPLISRPIDRLHEIIPELNKMDPRTPAFEPVMDTVERQADKIEKDKSDDFRERWGEMTEHMWNVAAERTQGKSFHAVADTRPKQD